MAIISVIALFLLFSLFIIAYLNIFWKRKSKHLLEVEGLKKLFNEELLQARIEIQEQTSHHISLEIHDNVGQTLILAGVQLNIMDQSDVINKDRLKEVKDTISQALSDLRNVARSLNTGQIQSLCLHESVTDQLDRIGRTGFINTAVKVEGPEQKLEEQKKLILFRIIQESLQNILKHSKAANVTVAFNYGLTELNISITDDGIGFDVSKEQSKAKGLGLRSILNRAAIIGCNVNIESTINKGTCTTIIFPYV